MEEYCVKFANLNFRIVSERALEISESLLPFLSDNEEIDINVFFSWRWIPLCLSKEGLLGEDSFYRYYSESGSRCYVTTGNKKEDVAYAIYDDKMKSFRCLINEKPFVEKISSLIGCLRLLPLKEIWLHYGILFLHSAQIVYQGKGILFAAPSGTGKTTQTKLWRTYRNAKIVCNDRTLIRKDGDKWMTYGYVMDGSEPIRSSDVNELGGVVLLQQAQQNYVEYLGVARTIADLMPQLVHDGWMESQRMRAVELLISLLESSTVLLLHSTADERAVDVLENALAERKIFEDG